MSDIENKQKTIIDARKQNRINELIDVVMRQTDYDKEQASCKLKEHNYNVYDTVREYMGGPATSQSHDKPKTSTNQMIYGEFRKLLDDAAKNYRIKKEKEEKLNAYIQQLAEIKQNATNNLKRNIDDKSK